MAALVSDQTHFIGQIQQKEQETSTMLKDVERENNQRVLEANEISAQTFAEAEQNVKVTGRERLMQGKEQAKEQYKRLLVDEDNKRRDLIEGGKVNLEKAKKYIMSAFEDMFR